jgi:hypothetical protein
MDYDGLLINPLTTIYLTMRLLVVMPVAVEKLPFSQNSQKLGDRKCLGGRSKSFVELPDAF